ncbi:MAG: pirin-like C-terminal cupin domain-containing protein [Actinomycetota bacterium]
MLDGEGETLLVEADEESDVLLLGGAPLHEPVAWYGPFVMNTRAELEQAVDDFRAGRMGVIRPLTSG